MTSSHKYNITLKPKIDYCLRGMTSPMNKVVPVEGGRFYIVFFLVPLVDLQFAHFLFRVRVEVAVVVKVIIGHMTFVHTVIQSMTSHLHPHLQDDLVRFSMVLLLLGLFNENRLNNFLCHA